MIDGNKLGIVGFEKLGTPYKQMDCQAFVEWCLSRCGLKKDLAGSNAWYREVMKNGAILSPEECMKQLGKVPAGAFLFILNQDGKEPKKYRKDGLGNASHIGIATGRGEGAIHSSASRGCVAESSFRGKTISGGWNRVGLWNRVSYDFGDAGSGRAEAESGTVRVPEVGRNPEKVPEPAEYAVVWAGQGSTVNTRQGPGTLYALSKAGRIPVGTMVEILKRQKGWCRIRYTDPKDAVWYCWMKEEFLRPAEAEDPEPETVFWSVTIPHRTEEEARELKERYPDCVVMKE